MAKKTKRARIKLVKHIIVDGNVAEKGKTLEMDRVKATELVNAGQAEFVGEDEDEEDGRELEEREQYGVRVETPTHGDPGPVVLDDEPRAPKPKKRA
jgi:hypothetical protein